MSSYYDEKLCSPQRVSNDASNLVSGVIITMWVTPCILISGSGGYETFIRTDIVFLSVYNPLVPHTIVSSDDMSIIIVITINNSSIIVIVKIMAV